MKGLVFEKLGHVQLKEVNKPILLHPTDAILKITLTTICGSDLHLMHGHIPTTPGYILGHEYVAVVEQVGSAVSNFKQGDRVVGPGAPFCGQCDNCRAGHIYKCLNGGILGSGPEYGNLQGSHSEYMRIPYADVNLLHVPDELTDEQVLFVGDILSTGYFSVIKGDITPGDTVVIFGGGPVGLCAVATAKLFNPEKIILVGRQDEFRMEMGKKLGATHTILSSCDDVVTCINELTHGKGADVAIEAAGSEATIQLAARCLGVGGRLSIVGIAGQNVTLPMFEMFLKNIRIEMGIVDLKHMKRLMTLIQSGKIDLLPLITHRMKLDEIQQAIKLFEERNEDVIKIALMP